MGYLDTFYSTKGALGVWTPFVVVILNAMGVALGLGLVQLVKFLVRPQYDLARLPQPPVGDWVLGHVKYLLRKDYHRVILGWAKQYGKIFKLRILNEWTVVITDPAAAAQVLATVPGRTHNYKHIDEVLGGPGKISMFGTPDEVHWRNARKTTAPAFSMANVRRYYGGVLSAAGELLTSLDAEQGALGAVDAEPLLQRLMLRATLEGLFEVPDATALPGFDTLASNILLLMAEANAQVTDPLRAFFYFTPVAPLVSKHVARCRAALKEIVMFHGKTAARILARPEPEPSNTLLWACLHRLRHPHTGRKLTAGQLHPEVGMYTTAGFDTTASTVGWCMYAASLWPEQQEAVAAELRAAGVFGRGAVVEVDEAESEALAGGCGSKRRPALKLDPKHCPGPEELAKLPRLNAFINEVMRMFPPTAISAERLTSDQPVTVMGMTFPAKTVLWCITYGIHMSDADWEEPAKFKPERWLEDSRCAFARSPGTAAPAAGGGDGPAAAIGGAAEEEAPNTAPRRFLPFGQGPKNCVGQNFGITVVRAVVALLLSRYRVALHPDMDTSPEGDKLGAGRAEGGSGCRHSAEDTARLTHVAVITKLKKLRLVLQRRDD
ncbi:hypothetical protein HYH02_012259 [Chlamydomonas schloesseri]|uniref:Cytochrome P450 n=1 Tax=Chlamydomonas schloesseri TaxID=2026947 RepID=A0A835W2B0_9CHLO|nr:hypothetical protein HYH02_012259 [Chlamydomonas schloesseri]|eukprot:KAG2434429.1 hypothetical protein HYH02_012259 [Chlamydomonas schloesseri]